MWQAPEVVWIVGIFGVVALKVVVAVEVGRLELLGIKLVVVDIQNNKHVQLKNEDPTQLTTNLDL